MRAWVGPVGIGVGVWCAAGVVAPTSGASASLRLVAPASLLWFVVPALVAFAVPAFRRRPLLAAPGLMSTVPWWPVPLPAAALMWTGVLAWLPIAVCGSTALAASVARRRASRREGDAAAGRLPVRALALATGLTLVAAFVVAGSLAPRLPGGDEPHYLVITQSLLEDGDLRIENNHAQGDYRQYFDGDLAPDFLQRGRDEVIYSIHAPGLPVLVLPAFAAFGYGGAQWTVLILSALAGGLVWLAGWLATRDVGAAWVGWAAICGSATFLIQGVSIFPDGPGAFAVALAVVMLLRLEREPPGPLALAATSLPLAALPWLHTRFVVLSVAMGVLIVWRVSRLGDRPGERARRIAIFLAVPVVSAAAWFAYFWTLYGSLNPAVPYGADPQTRLAYVPGGLIALLFDQQFGLLASAPILALAVVGWTMRGGGDRWRPLAWVWLAYGAAVATYWMWWAGVPATPARFLTASLPLLAPALAVGWRRASPEARALWTLVLVGSLALGATLLLVDRGALAWNDRDSRAVWLDWLATAVDLPRAWPSFFWDLTAGEPASELPFLRHVAVAALLVAGSGWLATHAIRRWWVGRRFEVAGIWAVLTATLVVQAGWAMTGASQLHPADAQAAALERATRQAAWVVGPGSMTRFAVGDRPLRIAIQRTDVVGADRATWSPVRTLPAGSYELHVDARRPRPGRLTLSVSNSPEPLRSWDLPARNRHVLAFALPVSVDRLVVRLEGEIAESADVVEILPLDVRPSPGPPARASLSTPDLDVFFLDDEVSVERGAFWTLGQGDAAMVLAARTDRAVAELRVTNGPTSQGVQIEIDGRRQDLLLASGEQKTVDWPWPASRISRVSIQTQTGFVPADVDPGSADRRLLGVRVEPAALGPP